MYLLLLLCVSLIGLYYIQTNKEPFIDMKATIHTIKQPHKHINRLKRKLRKTKEYLHKKHIRPLQVKVKKILHK